MKNGNQVDCRHNILPLIIIGLILIAHQVTARIIITPESGEIILHGHSTSSTRIIFNDSRPINLSMTGYIEVHIECNNESDINFSALIYNNGQRINRIDFNYSGKMSCNELLIIPNSIFQYNYSFNGTTNYIVRVWLNYSDGNESIFEFKEKIFEIIRPIKLDSISYPFRITSMSSEVIYNFTVFREINDFKLRTFGYGLIPSEVTFDSITPGDHSLVSKLNIEYDQVSPSSFQFYLQAFDNRSGEYLNLELQDFYPILNYSMNCKTLPNHSNIIKPDANRNIIKNKEEVPHLFYYNSAIIISMIVISVMLGRLRLSDK